MQPGAYSGAGLFLFPAIVVNHNRRILMKKIVVVLSLVLVLAVFAVPAVSAQAPVSQPVQIVAQDVQPPAGDGPHPAAEQSNRL